MTTKYSGNYNFGITQVEKNGVNSKNEKSLTYEDSIISITWLPEQTNFAFSLQNKSNKNFQIIWDDAAMVIGDGGSKRVFHTGVKYNEAEKSQPPTTVIKGSSISDLVLPAENVSFVYDKALSAYVWKEQNLLPVFIDKSKKFVEKSSNTYFGKKVIVSIPIKQGEKTIEYIFNFMVKDVDIVEKKEINAKAISWGIVGVAAIVAIVELSK